MRTWQTAHSYDRFESRQKPTKAVGLLLESLEICRFSHSLPTLCCFVTSAETRPHPLLFARLSFDDCFFLCIYPSEFTLAVQSFKSHISKVTLDQGEKYEFEDINDMIQPGGGFKGSSGIFKEISANT